MATRKIVPRADNEGGLGTALKRWATAFITVITCTTINALTLAAQAVGFTIAGGTTPKTLTVTANTALDEAVAMSSKLTIPGAWTTPAFNAANFTASGSMTWTVEAGDVTTYAYIIIGKMMTVSFYLTGTTVGGTLSTQLKIAIPAGKTATKTMQNDWSGFNGADVACRGNVTVDAGTTVMYFQAIPAWAASINLTAVRGQITFEIN